MTLITSDKPTDLIAGDMGPGNVLINDYVVAHCGELYDEGGTIALSGKADESLVAKWLTHPYFMRSFPKSLDRDTFQHVLEDARHLKKEDAVATLAEFTVRAVADYLPGEAQSVIVCGGGRKNMYIMRRLQEILTIPIVNSDDFSVNGDALEARAFAYIGARCYFGLPTSFPMTTGVAFPASGGRFLDV